MRISREELFLKFAELVATRSVCKRQQNGAVIVSSDFLSIYGWGYNGPPKGASHDECTNEKGNCGCVHAELNALLKAQTTRGAILFCTTSPCMNCAKAIINADIACVNYRDKYWDNKPLEYLYKLGVKSVQWHI